MKEKGGSVSEKRKRRVRARKGSKRVEREDVKECEREKGESYR